MMKSQTSNAQADAGELWPINGRGKVVLGFLLYNVGLTLVLDTDLPLFAWSVVAVGVFMLLFGQIENMVARRQRRLLRAGVTTGASSALATALLLGVISAATLFNPASAYAALGPSDQIRNIDEVLKGFHKPKRGGSLNATEKSENEKIKGRILNEDFDITELSRLSLGTEWNKLTPAKRSDFVRTFTSLLMSNAILHAEKHSGKEKIDYLGEKPIEERKGRILVKTRVEVPEEAVDFDVDYAMLKDSKKDRWRIYDLILDQESLVANYEEQFRTIIDAKGFDHLLSRMKKKLEEKQGRISAMEEGKTTPPKSAISEKKKEENPASNPPTK